MIGIGTPGNSPNYGAKFLIEFMNKIIYIDAENPCVLAHRRIGSRREFLIWMPTDCNESIRDFDKSDQSRTHYTVQFSTINPGTSAKCFSFAVTTIRPSESA